jgi:hypothetical protein
VRNGIRRGGVGARLMTPYWLSFTDGSSACMEAKTLVQAIISAEDLTGKVVTSGRCLPYPAVPRIGEMSNTPSFCYDPARCMGKSSCPKDHACTE